LYGQQQAPQHLAWHETLEMHELAALQAHCLMDFKMALPGVQDAALRGLYTEAIQGIQQNLRDLTPFYTKAPVPPSAGGARSATGDARADMTAFYAGKLLSFAKSAVRNYAIGITETATPALRETFQRHLLKAIQLHGKVFAFMYQHGYYPAYELDKLLANDLKMARQALSI
jgi:spore coat protein F